MKVHNKEVVLVTGASGLLGSNFILDFCTRYEIHAISQNRLFKHPAVVSHLFDLTAPGLETLLDKVRPTLILHFAAATNVDWCEENFEKAAQINVESTKRLALWSAEKNCKFVYMSTDSVFDGEKGNYTVNEKTNPINQYARTKLAGEDIAIQSNPKSLVVRSNIYGWNAQNQNSLAEWIISKLVKKEKVPGFSDVIFSPLLVNTLCANIVKMVDANLTGRWHLGCQPALSKYEFARLISRVFEYDEGLVSPVLVNIVNFKAKRPLNTSLICDNQLISYGILLPTIEEEVLKLKKLFDTGYTKRLKNTNPTINET
jgi:dTDP-4-dehydrorhamnose reductase